MNNDEMLRSALEKVPNRALLINMVAYRVRQLNAGAVPLVKTENLSYGDIALKEIIEGKLEPRAVKEERGRGRRIAEEVTG
jgi:DNA-directed RNA polymerase omega subunit